MQVNFVEKKKEWNNFVLENKGSFLQSFEWGEFQKKAGKKVWRIQIKEKKEVLFQAQIIKEKFPFKNCLYLPLGPVFRGDFLRVDLFDVFLREVRKISEKEEAIFLKVEPQKNFRFPFVQARSSIKRYQPQRSLVLDLSRSKEEIFGNFHPKTRYNVRLSLRKGVNTRISEPTSIKEDFESFYNLIEKTSKRDGFTPFSSKYYKNLLQIENNSENASKLDLEAKLFLAEFKGKIIAANIVLFFNQRSFYLHGAFEYKYRYLMAPYLLQWEQIRQAKQRGCVEYDFWGVDEEKWPGVTRFKRSFKGREIVYPEGKDFAFSKFWYNSYRFLKTMLFR